MLSVVLWMMYIRACKYLHYSFFYDDRCWGLVVSSIERTTKALIIVVFEERMTIEQCDIVIGELGDYLICQGY